MTTSRAKYPWRKWTSGRTITAYHGSDYTISTYNFQISLHGRARTEGKRVVTKTFKKPARDDLGQMQVREGITFTFWPEDDA